ncbi:nuclear transport factor 2 domain protein [Mycobacterium xenopi 4042]|uniref:Nuclear transport factor 2 domain protein n=1 Tax=Mycobacterium xenopi 4042 TaxID=1299334 RepID=X7ZVJ9_MYCXE|nr:nuclear transport factor 2 domain protein [Mycobacterium xenopi 4042]
MKSRVAENDSTVASANCLAVVVAVRAGPRPGRLAGPDGRRRRHRRPDRRRAHQPGGTGVHGKDGVAAFYDSNIAANQLTITCEETFPSSSPNEIAHILVLRSKFDNGVTSTVRGVFTYRVNDAGLITNMRGYWNLDAMTFGRQE